MLARVLGGALPEAVLNRADVHTVGWMLYVTLHACVGAVLGALLGAGATGVVRRGAVRALVLGAGLGLFDLVVLGALWRHRGLPVPVGLALVATGAALATAAAALTGLAAKRLPAALRTALAIGAPFALLAGTALLVLAASRAPARPPGETEAAATRVSTGVRVALVALDGLDGRLVDEAVAAGRMPNLAGLLARGVRGDLRSIRPPRSPVVWTSAVTGVLPRKHGILDFVVRRDGARIPVTSNLRRVPALWNLSGPLGFSVAFVNWYVTWPAEHVDGTIISDRADFDGLPDRVWPPEMGAAFDSARAHVDERPERDVSRFAGDPGELSTWRTEQWGQVHRSLAVLDDVVRHDLLTLSGAEIVLDRGQPDLIAVYFRGTDNTQHLFWKHRVAARLGRERAALLYGDIDTTEVRQLAPVIDRYYDFADELLGDVLRRLDPDTAILVVSDHGFLTNNERGRWFAPNRLLQELGLASLVAGGAGAADSARSRVFEPRRPSVEPRRMLRAGGAAEDAAAALADARARLDALRTDRGEAVLRSSALGEDADGPWLAVVLGADLAGANVELPTGARPVADFLQPEGHSGDHRMDGFLLAAGPPFRHGEIRGARAVDLAPTLACLLGVPAAKDQEGVVLVDLLDPAWLAAHPVRYVSSWGTREETAGAIATEADERIREELRALGYIK